MKGSADSTTCFTCSGLPANKTCRADTCFSSSQSQCLSKQRMAATAEAAAGAAAAAARPCTDSAGASTRGARQMPSHCHTEEPEAAWSWIPPPLPVSSCHMPLTTREKPRSCESRRRFLFASSTCNAPSRSSRCSLATCTRLKNEGFFDHIWDMSKAVQARDGPACRLQQRRQKSRLCTRLVPSIRRAIRRKYRRTCLSRAFRSRRSRKAKVPIAPRSTASDCVAQTAVPR